MRVSSNDTSWKAIRWCAAAERMRLRAVKLDAEKCTEDLDAGELVLSDEMR